MKREYDFSKAERGKFFKKGAQLRMPIYLDAPLQKKLAAIADRKRKGISEVVNEVLKKDVALVEDLT
jgi:cytidylate kinase